MHEKSITLRSGPIITTIEWYIDTIKQESKIWVPDGDLKFSCLSIKKKFYQNKVNPYNDFVKIFRTHYELYHNSFFWCPFVAIFGKLKVEGFSNSLHLTEVNFDLYSRSYDRLKAN